MIVKTILGAVLVITGSFFNISKADSGACLACNNTPTVISQINTMTREILSAIQTVGTAAPYAGKPVSPVRFEDGYFNPPKATIMSKSLRWAREGLGSILAVGRITLNINRYSDIAAGDNEDILKKGEIQKRDWYKMDEVGQEIANKKFALSVGGGRNEPIRSKTYKKIEDIILKYQDISVLSKDSIITPGVTYSQILGMLENLNTLAKHQIVVPDSKELTNNIGTKGLLIKISDTAIKSIAESYKCVGDQKCGGNKMIEDLKKILEMAKTGIGRIGEDIVESTERLGDAMIGAVNDIIDKVTKEAKELGMSNEEYTTLQSRFGLTAAQMKTAGAKGYKSDKRRSQQKNLKGAENEKGKTESLVLTGENLKTGNPEEEKFKLRMIKAANDIIDEAFEQRDYVMMAQNADGMTRFGVLSTKLTELENLVGNTSDGLVKSLGEACKNQCSNITSKKCFY